ncbi:protein kinase domain-containing protein [Ditylenchus destructor]|uniref:Protein kinase domain-containing protein n=1 Tax=Ditylenchus destructor TaxID=166010 RepID=A0AAD4MSL1_9BILA|nr:protein kinase domain-containing protein [Ditylenchus destructor]
MATSTATALLLLLAFLALKTDGYGRSLGTRTLNVNSPRRLVRKSQLNKVLEIELQKLHQNWSSFRNNLSLNDFQRFPEKRKLGRGSFGEVEYVEGFDDRGRRRAYALKVFDRLKILRFGRGGVTNCVRDIKTLLMIGKESPFLNSMDTFFWDSKYVYIVLRFANGGSLYGLLQAIFQQNDRQWGFAEDIARQFAAEIIMGLEYLHSRSLIYRDVKPGNLLINNRGHLQIGDFGMTKFLGPGEKARNIAGTYPYVPPEAFAGLGYDRRMDWYGLGVVIFQMLFGRFPYMARSKRSLARLIVRGNYRFPAHVNVSVEAKSIVESLLVKDPSRRLGTNGAAEVKSHPWFGAHSGLEPIQWNSLLKTPMRYRPYAMIDGRIVFRDWVEAGNFVEVSNKT